MQISKTSLQYISYEMLSAHSRSRSFFFTWKWGIEVPCPAACPCTCTSCLPLAGDATCVTPYFAQP